MVWKRNFLFLVCFGSLFAFVIFFKYRDEAITTSSHSFIGNTDPGRRQTEGFFNSSVSHLTNRQVLEGNSIGQDMYHHTVPYQSQPHFLAIKENGQEKPAVMTLAVQKDFFAELSSNGNSSQRALTDVSSRINSSAAPHTAVKSLSDKYNHVFQWNDKDPDGWKTLPFSKSLTASKMERVIFNRVGKCGSRSMINLLRDLAQKNEFNLISSVVYSHTHIPKSWEKHIVSVLDNIQPPYMFQRHLHYVNFKRHNASEVVYINIIREPIPRMVSQYYYARFGDAGEDLEKRRKIWPRSEEFNETVDECVQKQHRDCTGHKSFYIIPFFCGNSRYCIQSSRWALHRAISNVEKHFLVVGILEEYELTLKVLERMLPGYFKGASELYHSPKMAANISRTSTNLKVLPSNETVARLRDSMKYEYQFYEYIRARLFKQKEMLGL